ncbi:hypothetical protein ACF0H5_020841 [Mactra antiquata]
MSRSVTLVAILVVLSWSFNIGSCHVESRKSRYYISGSCKPVCNARQTCVRYITTSGTVVTRCAQLDPHRFTLEGTRIILQSHRHYNRQGNRPQTPSKSNLPTDNGIVPSTTADRRIINIDESKSRAQLSHFIPDVRTMGRMRNFPGQADTSILNQLDRRDKIEIRQRLRKAMAKTGVRPDSNSRLVDFKLHGVPARKQDVLLSVESPPDVPVEQSPPEVPPMSRDIRKISELLRPKFGQPLSEVIRPRLQPSNRQTSCVPCIDSMNACPTGEHCYHSQDCGIMICQSL